MSARASVGRALAMAALLSAGPGAALAAEVRAEASPLAVRTLANGLEILAYRDAVVPMVTVELVVRNGSSYETPATSGMAHLYEHLFWPDLRSPAAARIKDRGISFNASTREESTQFYVIAPPGDLRLAMTYLRDAALAPVPSFERLAAEKEVVLSEIRQAQANPYSAMTRRTHELLFPQNRTFKNPLGLEGVVQGASNSRLTAMQRRFVVPENLAVIVTGDCDPAAVFALGAELFGDLARSAAGRPEQADAGPAPKAPGAAIIESAQVEDVVIKLVWRGPGVETDRDATYAADVLGEILRQPASRFQRALVDTGLAIGVDVLYLTQRRLGTAQVLLKCEPARAREALRALRRELAALEAPGYFSDQELANARAALIADELYSREDLVRYSHSLGFWWASAGAGYIADRLERTRTVGRAEVLEYIRRYLRTEVHAVVAVLPAARGPAPITVRELLAP